MAPSSDEQGGLVPPEALDGGANDTSSTVPRYNNADGDDGGDGDGVDAPLPSVEAMEDLILEAYNNMQSDGEHIFLPPDVASKLQLIAELVKGAGYTSDDLVSNSSESNQEESARALLSSDQPHTAPPSAASSAPSSPPTPHLSLVDDGPLPFVSQLRLDDHTPPPPPPDEHDRKPKEALVLESNNFERDDSDADAHHSAGNNCVMEFGPGLSPVQEVAEDLLSVSDLDSVVEHPLDTLTPPKSSSARSSRDRVQQAAEKPKSMLRKPEVHRKSAIPARPSSVTKSQELNKPPSSGTRSNLAAPRVKTDNQAPPLSAERERSASSSYEQRREAAQKLREEKAQRELQARESARKQREDARRKLEEAQQKEMAAKRERVARMRMQKDQRKGPVKPGSTTR